MSDASDVACKRPCGVVFVVSFITLLLTLIVSGFSALALSSGFVVPRQLHRFIPSQIKGAGAPKCA